MDGFEVNKLLMAAILALLIGMVASKISEIMVNPAVLHKNVVIIEGVEDDKNSSGIAVVEVKLEPVEPLLAGADVQNGTQIARKCLQCHSLDKGGKAQVGPNLWGIVGNKLAHMDGYSYSKAIQQKTGQWHYEDLNAFLHKPREFIPGTKMSFAGLPKVKDRADLIAYLRTLSDSPVPLPAVTTPALPAATTSATAPPPSTSPTTVVKPSTTSSTPLPASATNY